MLVFSNTAVAKKQIKNLHRKLKQKKKVQSSVVYPSQVEFDSLSFLLHHGCLSFFVCLFCLLYLFSSSCVLFISCSWTPLIFFIRFLALKVTKVRLTAFSLSNIPSGILFHFCLSSWSRCVTCAMVIFFSQISIVVFENLLFYYILYQSLFYLFLLLFSFWLGFSVTHEMSDCHCN